MDQPIHTASPASAALTPMMAQYFEIRAANPGYLLFYRMGDFYELFFSDAEIASQALGIVLTKRGKHLGEDIVMCGVPVHAAEDYLKRLIGLGHRVAICEQIENPAEAKKRGAKSVVKRDVVRLVTSGTITEDELLPQRSANYLAALGMLRHGGPEFALAWADISTGETFCLELGRDAVADELARIDPAELLLTEIVGDHVKSAHLLSAEILRRVTVVSPPLFDSEVAGERLRQAFAGLDPSAYPRGVRAALGALVGYVLDSQKGRMPALRPPEAEQIERHMSIDAATRASLELVETQSGEKGSLFDEIDHCMTPAGSRLLARQLSAPLNDVEAITDRLDAVTALLDAPLVASALRQALKGMPDLNRSLTRLSLERGGPRDLKVIGRAIAVAGELATGLDRLAEAPAALVRIAATLADRPRELGDRLAAALDDEVPLLARDGNFVRRGHHGQLDAERALATQTRTVVAALQARLVEETDIKALKVRHNGVLGYFLEAPAAQGQRLLEAPFKAEFIHRQTLANVMRFTTAELAELEGRIARAHEAALDIELTLFAALRGAVLDETARLQALGEALAALDVTAGLAELARQRGWVRPLVDRSLAFAIEGGRHPVVESHVAREGQSFVANDCDLSGIEGEGGRLWLLTGPNMGGKSTFLRQNALIAILAQTGSYVPATAAHIGVVDRVFSRVGASDDIAHGRSTFMVEMVETAAILNRATERSLVILDEIGRGTATFDGLSIAWATVEQLNAANRCRALFATHFHELTALQKTLTRVTNHTMTVREWEGEVVFLHEVAEGAADRSYGIQVARLAGLPEKVLARAREVLAALEQRSSGTPAIVLDDLPLFAPRPEQVAPPRPDPLGHRLDAARPDEMTPREALDLVYELKKIRDAAGRS